MASKAELEAELRATYTRLFPKAIGKMKKHELEFTLASLKNNGEGKVTISEFPPAAGRPPPRTVSVSEVVSGDTKITVPQPPKPRVHDKSPLADRIAMKEAYGASSATPVKASVKGKGAHGAGLAAYNARRKAEKEAALLAAAPAPAPLVRSGPPAKKPTAAAPPVEEDDTDPKAARIVKAHKAVAPRPAKKKDDSGDMMAQFEAFLKSKAGKEDGED